MLRRQPVGVTGGDEDVAVVRLAQISGSFDDDAQRTIKVERHGADRAKDLANGFELLCCLH